MLEYFDINDYFLVVMQKYHLLVPILQIVQLTKTQPIIRLRFPFPFQRIITKDRDLEQLYCLAIYVAAFIEKNSHYI